MKQIVSLGILIIFFGTINAQTHKFQDFVDLFPDYTGPEWINTGVDKLTNVPYLDEKDCDVYLWENDAVQCKPIFKIQMKSNIGLVYRADRLWGRDYCLAVRTKKGKYYDYEILARDHMNEKPDSFMIEPDPLAKRWIVHVKEFNNGSENEEILKFKLNGRRTIK